MLKLNYFLADIFILSAEKQPIKLSWRKIEWLRCVGDADTMGTDIPVYVQIIGQNTMNIFDMAYGQSL